ncbi:MAG: exosortase/archaeosortase family protein [Gammaproteobacteria bacterium]|nr:MAG: exosortase/archaeosortase family protein [Gammaproteobacteria bacterium]
MKEGRGWSPFSCAMFVVLFVVAAIINHQPLLDILHIGISDEEQSHIFLVPVIAAWLLWLRKSRFRCVRFQPSLVGPGLIAAGTAMSWWGFNSGTQIAWHAGVGVVFVGVVVSMTGMEPLRQFAPVFGVLVFALPVPGVVREALAIPLQSLATVVTQSTLELIGVASTRLGNVLMVNGQQIAVGEACNGMRMVFAFFLIVYAFAFSVPLKMSSRLVLLAISPVVALLCNVIRLVPTSLIYGYGTAHSAEWFHTWTGWLMIPIALAALVGLLKLFRWLEVPVMSLRLAMQ